MTRRRRQASVLGGIVAPWTWFAVRHLSPYLDLLAIGLPLLVIASTAGAIGVAAATRRTGPAFVAASNVLFGAVAILGPMRPLDLGEPVHPVRIISANTGSWTSSIRTIDVVSRLSTDVLVIAELRPPLDSVLAEEYPFRVVSEQTMTDPMHGAPSVGVYSRWPLEVLPGAVDVPGVRVLVDRPDGPFVLYGLHVAKPAIRPGPDYDQSFPQHLAAIRSVVDLASREDLPVVVAGDLNESDRGSGYSALEHRLRDAMRASWALPTSAKRTFGWRLLLLRIDHVFVSPDWCARDAHRIDLPDADHRAVTVSVGACA